MLGKYLYKKLDEILSRHPFWTYMEIGSFDGEGISTLAKKYPDNFFISIDPFIEDGHTSHITNMGRGGVLESIRDKFKKNINGLTNIFHYDCKTSEFMCIYHKLNTFPCVDLLLIDGDHEYIGVIEDIKLAILLSFNRPLTVLMDDITKPGVNKAIKELKNKFKIKILEKTDNTLLFQL